LKRKKSKFLNYNNFVYFLKEWVENLETLFFSAIPFLISNARMYVCLYKDTETLAS